jgi:hypothetical protein
MVDLNTPLEHELSQVAVAERIAHMPTNTEKDDLRLE